MSTQSTKKQTAKHTPGPWTIDGEAVYANRDPRSRHRNGRACVANICTGDYDELDAEGQANASVISAAPDLYAIVRAEYDAHGGFETLPIGYPPERAAAICAAIAKAEGGGA